MELISKPNTHGLNMLIMQAGLAEVETTSVEMDHSFNKACLVETAAGASMHVVDVQPNLYESTRGPLLDQAGLNEAEVSLRGWD